MNQLKHFLGFFSLPFASIWDSWLTAWQTFTSRFSNFSWKLTGIHAPHVNEPVQQDDSGVFLWLYSVFLQTLQNGGSDLPELVDWKEVQVYFLWVWLFQQPLLFKASMFGLCAKSTIFLVSIPKFGNLNEYTLNSEPNLGFWYNWLEFQEWYMPRNPNTIRSTSGTWQLGKVSSRCWSME